MTATIVAPAHLWVPPGARGSYVDEVADVADLMRRPLDGSQRVAVEAMTSYGPRGRWLALETVIKGPRQTTGKTAGILTPIVFADLFLWDADRIAWTAHLFKTSRDAFADHCQLIESTPEFDRRIAKISYANGEESIALKSGAVLEYLARSKGGGRGLGGKRVVIDEALFFAAEAAGALLPIMAARENPQVMYGSSGAKVESDHLRALTTRGRAGGDPSLVLVEFCGAGSWDEPGCEALGCSHVVGSPGCALDDVDLWLQANTGVSYGRSDVEFLGAMRRTMTPLEFGREFLGWDEGPTVGNDPDRIPAESWKRCADPASVIVGPVVFSVDMPPGGAACSIGVAGRRADGTAHVGVVDYRRGTDWVAPRLVELTAEHETRCGIVWQPTAPIGGLASQLESASLWLMPMTAGEMAQACGALKDDVLNGRLRHTGSAVLDDAFASAERRVGVEGAWTWGRRKSAGDISPLVAATEALWGLAQAGDGEPGVYVF